MKTSLVHLMSLLGLVLFLFSCRSSKEYTFFQDITNEQHIPSKNNTVQQYKIKPYDNLYINIRTLNSEVNSLFDANGSTSGGYNAGTSSNFGESVSQYINGYQVDSSGSIVLPILGIIDVNGLTINQIQERIYKKSLEYLKEPTIKVKLLSFKVNVSGEVRNSGIYYSYNEKLTILEAISLAGGVTENAKLKEVIIARQDDNGTHTFEIDLTNKNFLTSPAYFLQPNDLVYIKPGKNKKSELNATSYSLFLSTITTILLIYNIIK